MSENPALFKKYILDIKGRYKGGISKDDVVSDKPVYKLSSNENMLGSSPKAIEAMTKMMGSLNEYPSPTDQKFREALSDYYGHLTPDQFITGNSGVALIQLIVNAFIKEDLECIYSSPTFSPYRSFPHLVGGKGVDVPLLSDFKINVKGILDAINDKTRLIWICSPNNPTGTYVSGGDFETIVNNVPDHVVVIYDEVYYQYVTAQDYKRAIPFVMDGKRVIGLNSFSKAYGLAGLRVGYAYSTEEIAKYVSKLRRPFHVNTLSQTAAIAALNDEDFISRTVDLVDRGKAFLYPELNALGVDYVQSQSNFFFMKPAMDPIQFTQLMQAEGIMIRPAKGFGAPDHVRITIGTAEANAAMIEGMKIVLGKA